MPIMFASGAAGEGGAEPEGQKELLDKINANVKAELEKRGYQDKSSVQKLMETTLEGLPLEALRKFDPTKVSDSLKNIAGELERVKNIRAGEMTFNKNVMQSALEHIMTPEEGQSASPLELMMRDKGQGGTKEIVLNLRAAAKITTANAINENNYPLEMIESVSLIDMIVKKRTGAQYVFDFADRTIVDSIEQYTSWLEEGNAQGAFAIVTEGGLKPLVSTSLVRNFAKAKKIAGKAVITEEFAKWRPKAWSAIQALLKDKIIRDYAAILTVDLQTAAASYVGTSLDGTFATPTDYDAIGAVAAQIETLNFFPDLLIIHPQDKWRLTLEKDSQGRYYMMVPFVGADGVVQMMGFRVLTSTYQTIGSFTLGESGLFKIEEETLTIRLGYGLDVTTATVSGTEVVTAVINDFDHNQMRLIIETFFKDWIATNHNGSFVTATFAEVKEALQAEEPEVVPEQT